MKCAYVKLSQAVLAHLFGLPEEIWIDGFSYTNEDIANVLVTMRLCGNGLPDECEVKEGHDVRELLAKITSRNFVFKWEVKP